MNKIKNNLMSNILAIFFSLIAFIFIVNLFRTPQSDLIFDTDGKEKAGGIAPVVEQKSLVGRSTKIYAPEDQYYDIYFDGPRRGTESSRIPDGNTIDYIGNDVELLQFVRNTNGSWVQVYDIDADQQYWVEYPATLPIVPRVDWDK